MPKLPDDDRQAEQVIAASIRQLAMADVYALLAGDDRDGRPAVLAAVELPDERPVPEDIPAAVRMNEDIPAAVRMNEDIPAALQGEWGKRA